MFAKHGSKEEKAIKLARNQFAMTCFVKGFFFLSSDDPRIQEWVQDILGFVNVKYNGTQYLLIYIPVLIYPYKSIFYSTPTYPYLHM